MLRRQFGAVFPSVLAVIGLGAAGFGQSGLAAGLTSSDVLISSVDAAPLHGAGAPGVIEGKYIVVLKAPVTGSDVALDRAVDRAESTGADVTRQYGDALNGFAATMSDTELASTRHDPAVAYVVADRRIEITGSRAAASWGQDRIDSRTGLDGLIATTGDGTGVTAYVIDTGVRPGRADFGSRIAAGFSAVSDGRGTNDCNGHGTHVAGTIGSSVYGVAPGVTIVPVRVLGCDGSGTTAGVIAGIDWVTAHHGARSVANLSLGGSAFPALDNSVANSIASGVTYAVAAGNSNADACLSSPARVPAAITVGAATKTSTAAAFSNWGQCVDLYAPGTDIVSDANADTGAVMMSGTSMASPHVAGAAALYLQANPTATPAQVAAAMTADATANVLTGIRTGTVNKLLHVLPLAPVSTVPTPTPTLTPTPTAPTPTPTPSPTLTPTPSPTLTPTPSPTLTRTPSPTASPGGPSVPACSATLRARRTLSIRGDVLVTAPYTTTRAGTHFGCLVGPASGANFDLVLTRLTGTTWATVASSTTPGALESIVWTGPAGQYRWQIERVSGYGSFTLRSGWTV